MLRAKYLISSHYSTIVLFNGFLFVIQLFLLFNSQNIIVHHIIQ